jgi:hypothetical protein
MRTITIELPDTVGFVRAGHTMNVATKDWSKSIVAQLVMHGATQKIGDAAASATLSDAEKLEKMTAVIDALNAGEWGRQRGNAGEPPIMRFIRAFIRKNLSKDNAAKYKAADDRDGFLDDIYAGLADDVRATVDAAGAELMEQDRLAREKAKKLGAAISF